MLTIPETGPTTKCAFFTSGHRKTFKYLLSICKTYPSTPTTSSVSAKPRSAHVSGQEPAAPDEIPSV